MKSLVKSSVALVFAVLGLGFSSSPSEARAEKVYHYYQDINFDKHAKGLSINRYDDGINIPDGYDDFQHGVKFVLRPGEDFKVFARGNDGSDGPVRCDYGRPKSIPLKKGKTLIVIDFRVEVNVDDGSSCEFMVKLSNGKKVVIEYYAIGT